MENFYSEITCTVAVETSGHKSTFKNARVNLCRNVFHDLILKLNVPNCNDKFTINSQTIVHKKFVKEGKASLEFRNHNPKTTVFFSNCPPDRLVIFLKALITKNNEIGKTVTSRERLLTTNSSKNLTDISPVTLEKRDQKKPTSIKRKLEDEKENIPPNECKLKKSKLSIFSNLTKEQINVIEIVRSGRNVFFTGSAGTGKSFLLKRLVGILPPEDTVICASTGVAACHVGGVTLHSFAGAGSSKNAFTQWQKCQHLIIDEISMVDGEFFSKLEKTARLARKNDKPFGGIQLILSGDFLQLPPVSKEKKALFCFQVREWEKCALYCIELNQVHRQNDPKFINILQNIRMGRCPEDTAETLRLTKFQKIDGKEIVASRLCTHKKDVQRMNDEQMEILPGALRTYTAVDNNPNYTSFIDQGCPVPRQVRLKLGSQVMLCKNLNVSKGLVNGARGVVTGFQPGITGLPIVKFKCGLEESVNFERYIIKGVNGASYVRQQVPLSLAWAISIHKSQGMTLDCVELCLKNVFEAGQAYVAMSRAKSLEGMRIIDFDPNCIRANSDVLKFYARIRRFF